MDRIDLEYRILSDNEIILEEDDTQGEDIETGDDLAECEYGPSYSEAFNVLDFAFQRFVRKEESEHNCYS